MSRYRLEQSAAGLRLRDRFSRQHPLLIDFNNARLRQRLRRGGRSEQLARAVGIRSGLRVLDCTAGLGTDGFLLATLGCEVTMLERSPVIFLLLQDALERVQGTGSESAAGRIRLIQEDAVNYLAASSGEYDVAVVDPMFPSRKKRAHVKGEMQLLQRFVGTDGDADRLLEAALESDCARVVLKRPRQASSMSVKPSHSIDGTSVRYDVYLNSP